MITKGFILETRKWKNVSLGKVQLRYLNMIAAVPLSAYDIFLQIKKESDIKNVRKTLSKLHSMGLIEVIQGKHPHGAKPYRLTSAGLFQYLRHMPILPYALKQYENNILLEVLLYQFLEPETLKHFYGMNRIELLDGYLKKCCQAITIRFGQYARSKFVTKFPMKFLMDDMDKIIMDEIKGFVFQIAINHKTEKHGEDVVTWSQQMSKDRMYYDAYSEIKGLKGLDLDKFKVGPYDASNFQYIYPIGALSRDRRFCTLLTEITKEFMDGSKELLYLTS